jgi:CRP/FNR family cyclic AMP-dependent transcriptional regulator
MHTVEMGAAGLLVISLDPGELPAQLVRGDAAGVRGELAGLLIASGLVAAELRLSARKSTQLLGPGDLLGASGADLPLGVATTFTVLRPTRLEVLDDRFRALAARRPEASTRVLRAALRQLEHAATQQAICQLSRVELRVLGLMWHVAHRWGRVTPRGIAVDLDLTHEAIGRLIGASRPSVSLALKWLEGEGAVRRGPGGVWLIDPESDHLLADTAAAPQRVPIHVGAAA